MQSQYFLTHKRQPYHRIHPHSPKHKICVNAVLSKTKAPMGSGSLTIKSPNIAYTH